MDQSKFKQMVINELDKRPEDAQRIAKIAGYSTVSNFRKFLNKDDKEMDSFQNLLTLVRELFRNREEAVLEEYCRTLHPNKKLARYSLEYAKINKMNGLLEYQIDRLLNSSNEESREWARIYNIYQLSGSGKLNKMETISLLFKEQERLVSDEMKYFSKLVILYNYYLMKSISVMSEFFNSIELNVDSIKDGYIKNSYSCRTNLIKVDMNIHIGNVEEARYYGGKVISDCKCELLESLTHLQLGNSYILESYEKSLFHYKKALEVGLSVQDNSYNISQTKRGMNFLSSYWGKKAEHLDYMSKEISDIHEIAFSNITNENIEDSLNLLNSIDIDSLNFYQKAFHYFYRGLATNEDNYFFKSVDNFKKAGDRFYRRLPLLELQRKGYNETMIEALS